MMHTRRGFLSLLTAAAMTATLDPERLLWTPGVKRIFIPPAPVIPTVDVTLYSSNILVHAISPPLTCKDLHKMWEYVTAKDWCQPTVFFYLHDDVKIRYRVKRGSRSVAVQPAEKFNT